MKILAALVILIVAAGVTPAQQITCRKSINCPCGSTGKNVNCNLKQISWRFCDTKNIIKPPRLVHLTESHQVCLQEEKQGDPCSRWSKCKTCRDGLDGCFECLDGQEGQLCSRAGNDSLSRQKRQFYNHPRRGWRPRNPVNSNYERPAYQGPTYPTNPVQQGGGSCAELSSPKLGSIRCLTSERETTCVGKCLPGYRFEGHDSAVQMTLTCRGGYYTPLSEFPPCKSEGHCNLVVHGSGSFNCTTGMKGTQCDVICSGRYSGRYFCYPGHNWEPHLPHCVEPKEVEESRQVCECEYGGSCDSKGQCVCPVGRTGRFCEELVPEKQTCGDPGFIANGVRKNPDESIADVRRTFEEGESVVYSCISEQYALKGSPLLTCKPGSMWSSPLPKCIRSTLGSQQSLSFCRDPGVDPNGSRKPTSSPSRQGFPQGSQLQFYCNEGYDLNGEKSIFCLTSGVWSARIPTCSSQSREPAVTVYCLNPGPILNGRIMYYPPLNSRRRGEPQTILEDPEYPKGSLMRYSCDIGYILEGSNTLTCGESGEWSDKPPICRRDIEPVYCLNPGDISNGRIEYSPPLDSRRRGESVISLDDPEFPSGGVMRYYCDRGFILEGSDSLTCEETGLWSSEPPTCKMGSPDRSVSFCRDPGVDPNGRRRPRTPPNSQGFPHGTLLEFFCNPGYELDGEKKIFCLSGEWLSERPKCNPLPRDIGKKYCPHPGSISNGRAAFFPPPNARLGAQTVTDLDNPEFPEGSRLQYSCNSGYRLQGSDSLICRSNGDWSAQPPVCRRGGTDTIRYCDNPGPVTNGKAEHVQFLNERRPRPPDDEDEEFVQYPQGSRLVYTCDRGFSLQGSSNLTCEETGLWSDDPPICVTRDIKHLMYCINPGPIRNGRIRYRFPLAKPRAGSTSLVAEDTPEYPEGTVLEYLCDDGYLTEGQVTLICESTGSWTSFPPKCNPDCGRSIMGTTRRIKNGNRTVAGEWPWVVAIAVLNNNNFPRLICGGAVINTRTVITAAHCVNKNSRFVLYFGKYFSRFDLDDDKVENRTSDTVIIHPDFNNVTLDSDIALITFRPRIKYSPGVQPICLPSVESTLVNLAPGTKGYVTGWGYTERRLGSDTLLMAHLPFVTQSDCLQSFRENAPNFNAVLTQNMFCAGYKQANQTTCRGDSGSPLVFYDALTEKYTLEGLVSFTVEGQCGQPGIYSVFTKVYKFLFWILANTR